MGSISFSLMSSHASFLPSLWLFLLNVSVIMLLFETYGEALEEVDRKVHIVYMGNWKESTSSGVHKSMLNLAIGSGASELLVHSYQRSFNGFAAKLSEDEAKKFAAMDEVVSVFPSQQRKLHTTKSWAFTGFPMNAARASFEHDVIIGMLDTGIWPESESFEDDGIGPPPRKWKGICQSSNVTCNNKIIGARYYHFSEKLDEGDIESPRDSEGHGSHTSSTVAGRQVGGASLYGLAEGTARGGVPSARIAVYKICWSDGCSDAAILAAFDDAIADGVDIISISVGGSFPLDYLDDSIAIGAFHAMKNGVLTSSSGGNDGPDSGSIANYSPWSLTVAASTIDRRFVAEMKLGNGKSYQGVAVNTFDLKDRMYPLVYGGDAGSRFCYDGSLDENKVEGRIVLCDALTTGVGPLLAGAIGAIMKTSDPTDYAFSYPSPTTVLGTLEGGSVFQYITTTRNPMASILKSEGVDDPTAPFVVSFSSRGPNPITKDILKPDLSAPGVDILAAWSPIATMSLYYDDKRSVTYNIVSGTSMACPHATGAAAYVKSFHPTWSPAAIKSSLMTTARMMNASINTDVEFAYGTGQINPVAALNPGLVYDAGEADYIRMLCGQGYSTKNLRLVSGDNSSCSGTNNGTVWDLNYPSFALSVNSGEPFSVSFKRSVINVGLPNSSYKTTVTSPPKLKISVEPGTFSFESVLEKKSFVVTVEGVTSEVVLSASIVLDDGIHYVRSPIVVYTSS